MLKVLFITNIPSPYRVDFFNELGKHCSLIVLFEKQTAKDRDKSWEKHYFINFQGIILRGKSYDVDKAVCFDVLKYLKNNTYDHIIISNLASITGILAIEYIRLKKMTFIIEGDGGFSKSGISLKEIAKRHLIKGAKAYFSTSIIHDEYYLAYGAKKENIYRYPFTSLKNQDLLNELISSDEKTFIKNNLNIYENKVIISVGQFIYRKGYDVLLKACQYISKSIGIYIIGGIPTQEYINIKEELKLDNIHFVGYKNKSELSKYYKLADLFVLPTRRDIWGLVINEAMSYGLPIITTNQCIAGMELVSNDENGYIVPINDEKTLAEKINIIINNNELRDMMSLKSIKKIKEYSIENMVMKHMDIFQILNKKNI